MTPAEHRQSNLLGHTGTRLDDFLAERIICAHPQVHLAELACDNNAPNHP